MVERLKTATAVILLVLLHSCVLSTQAVQIVSRSGWGARAPSSKRQYISGPVPYVVIHHTTGSTCTGETCKRMVRSFQNYHMNTQKWSDIGYSFLVGNDGKVYEGRGWGVVGAHAKGANSRSVAFGQPQHFRSVSKSAATKLPTARTAAGDAIKIN
ncbi:Peptidoglycan recognition protein 5 [Paragonimus heterotremus]|uniref:Peptidoglycan recognition protein 5 n=1 Tax=Paragonimus heterotremus TaxID=100268 RepID=A0A8J4SQ94_9TREM|nr:Peptidoglycan recognition protein 5 [Paragonimus heterotremus]